jgi:hypothetical protein
VCVDELAGKGWSGWRGGVEWRKGCRGWMVKGNGFVVVRDGTGRGVRLLCYWVS